MNNYKIIGHNTDTKHGSSNEPLTMLLISAENADDALAQARTVNGGYSAVQRLDDEHGERFYQIIFAHKHGEAIIQFASYHAPNTKEFNRAMFDEIEYQWHKYGYNVFNVSNIRIYEKPAQTYTKRA